MSPSEGSVTYCGKSFGFDREQEEANARLIAAAPTMLEALKQVVVFYDPLVHREVPVHELREVVRAAIAKAEGGDK
ncbi:MAG: hypothetical protein AB7G93_09415 [Bdellovibrionales bacterium]